ncbi:MAG: hypothetical protein ACYC2I_11585 [Elusimicrobiales bacterium]
MTDEAENLPAWRKKFLATRMTFESLLFERELIQPKREKLSVGLLGVLGIWLAHALLLAQWAWRRGYFFSQADAESFSAVLRYAAYLKGQGVWALVKPEFADLSLNPPLYYLSFVPVLEYLTPDLNLALVLVNSFFLLVLALAVFLAVRRNRPNAAGWLGAAFALALPAVMETARRPSPEMALMALTAAMYACYINSDEFEHPKWSFAFAVVLSLGFFSHRFFWLYALPLLPFILAGLSNPNARDELFKGFFPGAVINLPWYLFLLAALAAGFVPLWGAYKGFWHYFGLGVRSAGLPLFALGAAGLFWMYFSVFMPYEKRKVVAAWFWAPYVLLTWLVRGSHPELLYPALIPFAVALPVMTPHSVRRYLLVFVLTLGVAGQGGLVRPFHFNGLPMGGLPLPPAKDYRAGELLALVKAAAPAGGGLVGVYGGDANLNAQSLRYAYSAVGSGVKFADAPACPACAFVVIRRTPRRGEAPSPDSADFSAIRTSPWFGALYDRVRELDLADGSRAEVYRKRADATRFFEEGRHNLRRLALGGLTSDEAALTLSGFDPATGRYASAELFVPSAQFLGGDVYGLTLDIKGLSAAGPGKAPFVPSGYDSINITSARISAYAVERYLAARLPFLSGLQVTLDGGLGLTGTARGRELEAEFALAVRNNVLEVRPASFGFGPLALPGYFLRLFTFRMDFSDNPYNLRLNGLRVKGQMIELY